MTIYRGYEVTQAASGHYEWTDEQGRVHTGKVDTKGGYKTEEEAFNAIDAHKRAARSGGA
jgi:uncharacterized protein YegP (UPF0339 family)